MRVSTRVEYGIPPEAFQRVTFAFDISDDNFSIVGFFLLSDQHQVSIVDSRAYHGISGSMENEKVAVAE